MQARIEKTFRVETYIPYILLIAGVMGFLASLILTVDTIKILQNPEYTPGCNINPIISCGSVMRTEQSAVLGFPNSIVGIAGFAGLATLGTALLAGAKFKRWLWLLMQGGGSVAVLFVHWLIFESLYKIGSLCPFCMAVWMVTIPAFWYLTLYNLKHSSWASSRAFIFAYRHHADILVIWLLAIITLILSRFWYYWSTLL